MFEEEVYTFTIKGEPLHIDKKQAEPLLTLPLFSPLITLLFTTPEPQVPKSLS